ncbi:hypothetical protein C7H62_0088 [Mesoflavibacter sp. HG96]|uniref:OB-fold putative lipoprotein n=1 Tax=Mesoflavibacter profundi TaxID=2708110 RepID=A0ABT4RZB1_9FLAO|nr:MULTISPECIES: hypothetical protein [Mesoflavibacter]MDA0176983.1 OB-fold putative lipoprotein [Mesoflavibacter profundi]QIJ87898.1 hypothetical protein C7H62_0088 [Mesoflavibacter sp. HG96]QIJ90626.1 hypothetical protein C7H56_0088 [Mesoflavibacter sp. HG37]
MKRKILIFLGLICIGLFFTYNYIYQDHRNIANEKAQFSIEANLLKKQFQDNPSAAQQKFLDQTIEVSGKVTAIDTNYITLNNLVFCSMPKPVNIKLNSTCTIKGRFIGYDDLLEEIKLDQCTLTN